MHLKKEKRKESDIMELNDSPIFDERERKSGLIDRLKELKKPHRVMMLLIGDFTVSERLGGEIKRIKKKEYMDRNHNDLVSSLYDNRIYTQSNNLNKNYQVRILIIEIEKGASLFTSRFTEKHWASLRLSLEIDFGIHIYFTEDEDETIDLIYALWEKEKKGKHYVSPCNKKPRPKSLREQQMYLLSGLLNIGDEKTAELLDIFKNPLNVIAWIIDTEVPYTKTGKPKRPTDAPKGFGASFFLSNKKLLTGE